MEQKLNQLQAKIDSNQNFVEKLFSLETPEEVQSFLKQEGMEFSLEEIDVLRKAAVKSLEKGELSEEDLEKVAGGVEFVLGMKNDSVNIVTGIDYRGNW
ncbi:MAG: Nif11-like leader peptide family natural product precursor [Syntrophomonadaceae bacterium]|nr:Nif11-like leader peptide family natural product precursor [Syntrophomonadaceae bacterium]